MANQVPDCPSTGLLIKYVRGSSIQIKPNKPFLFSFQNKTYSNSWVSKAGSSDTELWVCLTHGYRRVQEEKWQVSFKALISWEQRTEKESSLPINLSGSKRARAHAQHEQ